MGSEGQKNSVCEVSLDERYLEQISSLQYLELTLDETDTEEVECCKKVTNRRKVVGPIKSLANDKGLRLECEKVLYEGLHSLGMRQYYKKRMKNLRLMDGRKRRELGLGVDRWMTLGVSGYLENR